MPTILYSRSNYLHIVIKPKRDKTNIWCHFHVCSFCIENTWPPCLYFWMPLCVHTAFLDAIQCVHDAYSGITDQKCMHGCHAINSGPWSLLNSLLVQHWKVSIYEILSTACQCAKRLNWPQLICLKKGDYIHIILRKQRMSKLLWPCNFLRLFPT